MTAVTYFVYDRDNIHKKKLASAEKALDWNGTPAVDASMPAVRICGRLVNRAPFSDLF